MTRFKKITDSLHQSFIELAKDNPQIDFIIKGKNVESSFKYIEKILNQYDVPKNLKLDFYTSAVEILAESRVVSGLFTTAIFEALAAKVPVIVPRYYEAIEKDTKEYFLHLRQELYLYLISLEY